MTPRNLPVLPAFISPLQITVPVDQVDVLITALGIAQIAEVLHVASPVLDGLFTLDDETLARLEAGAPNMADMLDLLHLFDEHQDAALRLVALGTRQSGAWVGELLPDRFAYLFACVVMVNADFFSRARPVFRAAGEVLSAAKAQQDPAGSTGLGSSTP